MNLRVQNPLIADNIFDLSEKDLEGLQTYASAQGATHAGAKDLKKIRSSHHQAAQFLATGMPALTVAVLTGYTPERLSQLQSSPAFIELMSFYSGQETEVQAEVAERLRTLSLDVVEVIQEKLLDEPEKLSLAQLNDLLKTTLDRTGHGPTSTTRALNVVATGTLEELRGKLGEGVTLRAARVDPKPVAQIEAEGVEGGGTAVRETNGEVVKEPVVP